MDEEIKKICEGYAYAWYFDHPRRLEWQDKYFKKRHILLENDKILMDSYFDSCMIKNEKLLPDIDYVGPFESYLIN